MSPSLADDPDCPWLNISTAAALAGGPVTLSVIRESQNLSCSFVRHGKDLAFTLQIEVAAITPSAGFPSYLAECKTGAEPLRGVGNEAVACKSVPDPNGHSATVVGRVRNQAFVVRLSSHGTLDTETQLRQKSRDVAEQVAGNLF